MSAKGDEAAWFRDGLCFTCTQCGQCCTGAPGYVFVEESEVIAMAGVLEMAPRDFVRRYVRRVRTVHSLTEKPNGDCVLWDPERGCTVYAARPGQCRSFPFWRRNLETASVWAEVVDECPGAGQGRRYSAAEIERIIDTDGDL